MLLTFALAVIGWIIFRTENIGQVGEYLAAMCNNSIFSMPDTGGINALLMNIVIMLCVEWLMRTKQHGLEIKHWHPILRYVTYLGLLFVLFAFSGHTVNFIYFQF